jgi:hypothetical protein
MSAHSVGDLLGGMWSSPRKSEIGLREIGVIGVLGELSVLVPVTILLMLSLAVVSAFMLRKRRVTSGLRVALLIGGVILLGLLPGLSSGGPMDPNPVSPVCASLRVLLAGEGGSPDARVALVTVVGVTAVLLLPGSPTAVNVVGAAISGRFRT